MEPKARRPSTNRLNARRSERFSILSPQGRVLFHLAACPDSPVDEIAPSLGLTERSVWSVVRDLRRRSMVHLHKVGRRHHYTVNLDAPLLHPTISDLTLRSVLGKVVAQTGRQRPEVRD